MGNHRNYNSLMLALIMTTATMLMVVVVLLPMSMSSDALSLPQFRIKFPSSTIARTRTTQQLNLSLPPFSSSVQGTTTSTIEKEDEDSSSPSSSSLVPSITTTATNTSSSSTEKSSSSPSTLKHIRITKKQFSHAQQQQQHHHRLVSRWKRRWRLRLLRKQRHRRDLMHHNQHQHQEDENEDKDDKDHQLKVSLLDDMDIWGIEKTRQELKLPNWVRTTMNWEEERHLAAMKIILDPELQQLQHKTVQVFVEDNENDGQLQRPNQSQRSSPRNNNNNHNNNQIRTYRVVDIFPDVYSDLRLLRFLRKDKIQDPVTAAMRYSAFLSWRDKYDIDQRVRAVIYQYQQQEKEMEEEEEDNQNNNNNNNQKGTTTTTGGPFRVPPHLAVVGKYLPTEFQIVRKVVASSSSKRTSSRNNNIINNHHQEQKKPKKHKKTPTVSTIPILLNIGSWDTIGITKLIRTKQFPLDAFLQYWIFQYESLHEQLYSISLQHKELYYIDEICDLTHLQLLGLNNHNHHHNNNHHPNTAVFSPMVISTIIQPWLDMTQKYYPETTARIVLYNPPKILSMVWNLITPLVSRKTMSKVELLSDHENHDHDNGSTSSTTLSSLLVSSSSSSSEEEEEEIEMQQSQQASRPSNHSTERNDRRDASSLSLLP